MRLRMGGGVGFDEDIRPLFRAGDQACMSARGIDLGDWWEVRRNSDAIFAMVSSGKMPPDTPWDKDKFGKFADWREEGMPKKRAENESVFFKTIDERTEFESPPGSGVMKDAIAVMTNVFPKWKDFAGMADPADANAELGALKDLLAKPPLKISILAIDGMLCDVVKKFFADSNGIVEVAPVV